MQSLTEEAQHPASMSGDLRQDAGPPEAPVRSAEARGAPGPEAWSRARWPALPGPGPAEPLTSQEHLGC